MVRHRDTGLLTANASSGALAQALKAMVANSELFSRCSAHGRREWETRFRLQRFQSDIAGLIAEAANDPLGWTGPPDPAYGHRQLAALTDPDPDPVPVSLGG